MKGQYQLKMCAITGYRLMSPEVPLRLLLSVRMTAAAHGAAGKPR